MRWMGTLGQGGRGSYCTEAWNKGFLFHPCPHLWLIHQETPHFLTETAARMVQQHTRACGCLAQEHVTTVPGCWQLLECWQLLCCCQHPELLLESSLEQHPEVGAASRGAAVLDQSSSQARPVKAPSNMNTYRKGHQAGDAWMGMRGKKRSLLGGEGARALPFTAQPGCLARCTLIHPCQA